ncbi:hypothetical protein ES703_109611 [subsurface metagenome]
MLEAFGEHTEIEVNHIPTGNDVRIKLFNTISESIQHGWLIFKALDLRLVQLIPSKEDHLLLSSPEGV